MTLDELEQRLRRFQDDPRVEQITISESGAFAFRVTLNLKPGVPLSERFLMRLETALEQRIGSLAYLRIRANATVVRFTIRRSDDLPGPDRVQEVPALYAFRRSPEFRGPSNETWQQGLDSPTHLNLMIVRDDQSTSALH